MTNVETRQCTMLTRVKAFGEEQRDRLARSTAAPTQFEIVGIAVAQLREYTVAQLAAERMRGGARAAARVMAPQESGMGDRFRLPVSRKEQTLTATGLLFAREAEPFADLFISHGLPPTFLADLRGRVASAGEGAPRWRMPRPPAPQRLPRCRRRPRRSEGAVIVSDAGADTTSASAFDARDRPRQRSLRISQESDDRGSR